MERVWIAALAVGVLVWGLIYQCVVIYRRRRTNRVPGQVSYLPLEILYTIVHMMVAVLFYYTARDQAAIADTRATPDVRVHVVAKRWSWDFNYVDDGVYETGVQADLTGEPGVERELPTLYLPVNERVEFVLTSRDVIHSFWIPAFLYKLDAIPGIVNTFQVVPQRVGTYRGKCGGAVRGVPRVHALQRPGGHPGRLRGAPGRAAGPGTGGGTGHGTGTERQPLRRGRGRRQSGGQRWDGTGLRMTIASERSTPSPVAPRLRPRGRLVRWLTSTDHKVIGNLYLTSSFAFFMIGGVMALVIRAELFDPGLQVVSSKEQYNQLFTMHGTIMLLLFATPLFAGFANAIMPLQIGAPDVAFPRLNMLSYWLYLFGGLIAAAGFLTPQGAASFGWFAYAPLSSAVYSPGLGSDLWVFGLALAGFGTILGAVNFITTVVCMRAPGMTMFRMPIFTWNVLITSILV